MATIAIMSTGTLFQFIGTSSAGSPVTIPEVKRLTAPDTKYDLADATSHDSTDGFREYIPGLKDGDNVTAEVQWKPSNTVHQDVRDANLDAELIFAQIVFPDASENTMEFAGYFVGRPITANVGELLMATLTQKVTGPVVWS